MSSPEPEPEDGAAEAGELVVDAEFIDVEPPATTGDARREGEGVARSEADGRTPLPRRATGRAPPSPPRPLYGGENPAGPARLEGGLVEGVAGLAGRLAPGLRGAASTARAVGADASGKRLDAAADVAEVAAGAARAASVTVEEARRFGRAARPAIERLKRAWADVVDAAKRRGLVSRAKGRTAARGRGRRAL